MYQAFTPTDSLTGSTDSTPTTAGVCASTNDRLGAAWRQLHADPGALSAPRQARQGAHHVITEVAGALIDIGYTIRGQAWTYWNRGPGPGEETWLTTEVREWTTRTARTAAGNLVAVARALQASGMPTPSTLGT